MSKLRVAVCGSGNRSRTVWQKHIASMEGLELVGVQDIAQTSLDRAIEAGNIERSHTYLDLGEMLSRTRPDALMVCCINEVHASAIETGLNAGCHVLTEKPFTTDLEAAGRLAKLSEDRKRVLAVVQNWRTKSVGLALHDAIKKGVIGDVSHIFFRYVRDRELPHLPDYLFEEEDPLLLAVSIHHLDLFRYCLGQEITKVEGHAFRPAWSRYKHPSGVQLWIETSAGVVISYVATFSSRNGHLPIESLQVEGESGTLFNESNYSEPPLFLSKRGTPAMVDLTQEVRVRDSAGQYEIGDRAVLANFREAVLGRALPLSAARENLGTLASVEAARLACRQGKPVDPRDLLAEVL